MTDEVDSSGRAVGYPLGNVIISDLSPQGRPFSCSPDPVIDLY